MISIRFNQIKPDIVLFKAFGQQLDMFSHHEGDTRQGVGGMLKLERNPAGKGVHWRLLSNNNNSRVSEASRESKPIETEKQKGENADDKTEVKIISPQKSYNILEKNMGSKLTITDKEGKIVNEGIFRLMNENADKTYSMFIHDKKGDHVLSFPSNQLTIMKSKTVEFHFEDKNYIIHLDKGK